MKRFPSGSCGERAGCLGSQTKEALTLTLSPRSFDKLRTGKGKGVVNAGTAFLSPFFTGRGCRPFDFAQEAREEQFPSESNVLVICYNPHFGYYSFAGWNDWLLTERKMAL
jgi:hypothetical protein